MVVASPMEEASMLPIEDELNDTPESEMNTDSPEHEAPEEYGEIEAEPANVPPPPDLENQNPMKAGD